MDSECDNSYGLIEPTRFKICVLGDVYAGKTCLSVRFINNTFREKHKSTISDIETKNIRIHGHDVVYQIWDTAGQERFRSLLPLYMKGIDGAIIVYDVTNKESFKNINMWYNEVQKHATGLTVVMIVGNKLDLVKDDSETRQVTTSEGEVLSGQLACSLYEASAKTGENVTTLFTMLGEDIAKKKLQSIDKTSTHISIQPTLNLKEHTQGFSKSKKEVCC